MQKIFSARFFFLFVLTFSNSAKAFAPDTHCGQQEQTGLVSIEHSIEIDQTTDVIFQLVKDATNDHLWRSEVHQVTADRPFALGARFFEDARLGLHPHYFTETEVVAMNESNEVIYETVPENPYCLRSTRRVESLSNGKTKLSYRVEFERDMMIDILGTNMPIAIVKAGYGLQMKAYLLRLRALLETHDKD